MLSSHYRLALVWTCLVFFSHVASQQPKKIDDSNVYIPSNPNGIQFSDSGWSRLNTDGAWDCYDETYTHTQDPMATLIYFFRGTGIAHYANKGPSRGPVVVTIDGGYDTNYTWSNVGTAVEHQQQMWSISGLAEGDHQVTITNLDAGNATGLMGVDYLEVTPGGDGTIIPITYGPGATSIPANAVLVDDTSDAISYSGSWGLYDSSGFHLGGQQHYSTSPGSALTFKFNGTGVWYFTDRWENNTIVSISLDGAPAEMVDSSSPVDIWLAQVLTWGKTGLSDGPHILTITHAGAKDEWACLDFFKYMPSSLPPTAAKSVPIGAIVGGAVGGVVVLGLIVSVLVWRRRRRAVQDTTVLEHEKYEGDDAYGGKQVYASTVLTGATYVGHPEIHQ